MAPTWAPPWAHNPTPSPACASSQGQGTPMGVAQQGERIKPPGLHRGWGEQDTLAGSTKTCRANRRELGSAGTGSLQGHGSGDTGGAQSGPQGGRRPQSTETLHRCSDINTVLFPITCPFSNCSFHAVSSPGTKCNQVSIKSCPQWALVQLCPNII